MKKSGILILFIAYCHCSFSEEIFFVLEADLPQGSEVIATTPLYDGAVMHYYQGALKEYGDCIKIDRQPVQVTFKRLKTEEELKESHSLLSDMYEERKQIKKDVEYYKAMRYTPWDWIVWTMTSSEDGGALSTSASRTRRGILRKRFKLQEELSDLDFKIIRERTNKYKFFLIRLCEDCYEAQDGIYQASDDIHAISFYEDSDDLHILPHNEGDKIDLSQCKGLEKIQTGVDLNGNWINRYMP